MLHTTRILDLTVNLPIIVEVIDEQDRIEKAAAIAKDMVNEGLIMITDINVVKYGKNAAAGTDSF